MTKENTSIYFISFKDKFIIYQPLNQFAFIGNSAMVKFIKKLQAEEPVGQSKHEGVLLFLKAYGFFEQRQIQEQNTVANDYKPTVCVLCMTSACNFSCTYCFTDGGEGVQKELALKTGQKAIDIVYNNSLEQNDNPFVVSFHGGGEPTLPFEKMKKLTEYARGKDKNCVVELTSNGYWNDKKIAWVLSNINNLTLSFDGREDIQNKQRPLANGKETFLTIMSNIIKLDYQGLKYGIRLTVTNESISYLPENIKFLCQKTGCTTFQVEPAFGAGRALSNKQTIDNNKQFVKQFLEAYDIAVEHGRHLYYSGARPWTITKRFCTAHDNALVVTPDGLLSSCYEISGSSHPLARAFHFGELSAKGDLFIDNTIRDHFNNKIRERKSLCEDCFCYWHCAGDCPAKTFSPENFDNNTFTERCDVNREITRELLIRYMSQNDGVYKLQRVEGWDI